MTTKTQKSTQSLNLNTYIGYASIFSTDGTTKTSEKATTDLGYGVSLEWTHLWSDTLRYFINGSVKKFKFNVGAKRKLKKPSQTQFHFETGLKLSLSNRWILTPSLGTYESLILTSLNTNLLEIKKARTPQLSLEAQFNIHKFTNRLNLYTKVKAGLFLPREENSFKTNLGHYREISLGPQYNLKGLDLRVEPGYSQHYIDIGKAEQKSKNLGVNLGVRWSF